MGTEMPISHEPGPSDRCASLEAQGLPTAWVASPSSTGRSRRQRPIGATLRGPVGRRKAYDRSGLAVGLH
ncbi:subtilisin inhibitor-like protein 1 family protein [Sutterella parvirubra YIT 11816]|uniref:Subtilisin inhibitor-like protein 1 family protein n=1 Tax=Sutterella parvirubra YIT 11816 TaxID=762967 RepID=H3KGC7_9BURK|nr:subtilisin inhibitor-like protein 1 family protein [Sutterella parvirubra YIT 11816]